MQKLMTVILSDNPAWKIIKGNLYHSDLEYFGKFFYWKLIIF